MLQIPPPQGQLLTLGGPSQQTSLVQWEDDPPPMPQATAVAGMVDELNNSDQQRVQWLCATEPEPTPFDQAICAQLEKAHESKSDVTYEISGRTYRVDWACMLQINCSSGARRGLIRKVEMQPHFGSLEQWQVVYSHGVNVRQSASLGAAKVHDSDRGTAKHGAAAGCCSVAELMCTGEMVISTGEMSEDGQWIKLTEYAGVANCWMRWSTNPNESDLVQFVRKMPKNPTDYVVSSERICISDWQ